MVNLFFHYDYIKIMKKDNSIDKDLRYHFQQQKVVDGLTTPSFHTVFRQAQQQQQAKKRRNILLIAASVAILAVISFVMHDDVSPRNMDKITIAKSTTRLYESLMMDGKIVTNDIHFEYDVATVRPSSMHLIKTLAKMLKKHPRVKLSIEGHTDISGCSPYNQQLSYARAYEVRQNLIQLGITPDRLIAKGFGESRPAHPNTTEKGMALNRRVEFVLIE